MWLGALSGFTIAITADRRREEQAQLIVHRGGRPLLGPVIRTLPLGDEATLQSATESLIAAPPDIVVVSTALGIRGWFSGAEGLGLDDSLREVLAGAEVIARGPKAAGAALALGIDVSWVTPEATYAEVIDRLVSQTRPDGARTRVAVLLDGANSGDMAATLTKAGYDVVEVRVYDWTTPEDPVPAERLVAAVADRLVDAVTFTSAAAVENFVQCAADGGSWELVVASMNGQVVVCCVGPVTARAARQAGVLAPIAPARPRLGAMVQALVSTFADRAVSLTLDGHAVVVQGSLVLIDGTDPIYLPDRERGVLDALVRRPGAVVSKRALIDEVWAGTVEGHVVEVTIGRLRRRLGDVGFAIDTVMRRGYRLDLG